MKRIRNQILAVTACAIALGVPTFTPALSAAEDYPRGAERLMKMKPLKTAEDVQAVKEGDMVAMACPKCKTITYAYVEPFAKGAEKTVGADVKTGVRHTCPGCGIKITSTAGPKETRGQLQHTCKECGSHDAFCCVLVKKSDKAKHQ